MSDLSKNAPQQQRTFIEALGLGQSAFLKALAMILGLVLCCVTLATQQDPEMVQYVLGGAATLIVVMFIFT